MLVTLVRRVRDHPLWALGWAIFIAAVVFFAGEYNTTEENTLALARDFSAVKAKDEELSEAFELMRQQQAFFGYYRNREDEYKSSNLHRLSRAERDKKIDGFLDTFGEMRSRVGETISEIRSTALDHPRLSHAKDLILGDLLVADELLQARIDILERARLSRSALLKERAASESLIHQERLKRMWEDVDARGSQAQDLLFRVKKEIRDDVLALDSKAQAELRRTYVRWASIAYILIFMIAFPLWLVLTSRRSKKSTGPASASAENPVHPKRKMNDVPSPAPAAAGPPAAPVAKPPPSTPSRIPVPATVPMNPHKFVADIMAKANRRSEARTQPPGQPDKDADA